MRIPMGEIKEYYKAEYKDAKRVIEKKYFWAKPDEVVNQALDRMLGVAFFVQRVDESIPYDELDELFNFYKEELELLRGE